MKMPNLRKMFTPDDGHTLFEADLAGADARVVAWEADDTSLKLAFQSGRDVHAYNAEAIWRREQPLAAYRINPDLKHLRQRAKTAVHAVNYGCKARTLAEHISTTTSEAELFISQWFRLHPGILEWHRRIEKQLWNTRTVANVYGYKRRYFDRPEGLLPEALAWIGQSTTAICINHLMVRLAKEISELQILLQTHDSVTFQIPTDMVPYKLPEIKRVCESAVVPYPDPLPMPVELSSSTESWGEVKPL
jgi:DNA polymerase I